MDVYKQTFQYIAWPTEACSTKNGIILPPLSTDIAKGISSNSQVTTSTTPNQQGQYQNPPTFKEIQQKLNLVHFGLGYFHFSIYRTRNCSLFFKSTSMYIIPFDIIRDFFLAFPERCESLEP